MPTFPRIHVIGANGSMGGAVLAALARSPNYAPGHLSMSVRGDNSFKALKEAYPEAYLRRPFDRHDPALGVDVLLLAMKPSQFAEAALQYTTSMQYHGSRNPLVLSLLAGTTVRQVGEALGARNVVRAMPNQGAQVGCSATGVYAPPHIAEAHKRTVEQLLRAIGSLTWVANEDHMHGVTACAGSGTGFVFEMMHRLENNARQAGQGEQQARAHAIGTVADGLAALQSQAPGAAATPNAQLVRDCMEAAVNGLPPDGLPKETARALVAETFHGAVELARSTSLPFPELIRQVASPGGTTEAGLNAMARRPTVEAFAGAVAAASARSVDMATKGSPTRQLASEAKPGPAM